MPQKKRNSTKWENFNIPVSYRVNASNRMRDARNIYSNQDLLRTRHGFQRWNTNTINSEANIQTVSYYKGNSGTRRILAKAGTKLFVASEASSHTEIKSGLTSVHKHRSVTMNGRAIISCENDGLFSFDGTTFTQLGQSPPSAPSVAASGSGNTLTASDYQVATTFYASSIDFETNIGVSSSTVTVASAERIDVTSIDATAENELIDKVRVYVKDVSNNGGWLFWDEINLGTTTETIDADPTSTDTPPTTNGAPFAGGGKFLAVFGKRLAYAGSESFPSDVIFSEEEQPDAFNPTLTAINFKMNGQGPITGLAVGLYNSDNLLPYICAFKESRIEMYTEVNGQSYNSIVSENVGCVNHDTISVIDGDIWFMSESGWRVIVDGKLLKKGKKPFKLGDGDIDNIFNENGYVYELNKQNFGNFFSVYYPTLNQYLTFVSEGASNDITKAYNYEIDIEGFRPYDFPVSFNGACLARDGDNEEVVLLAGNGGYIYKHSINVTRSDSDIENNSIDIAAFGLFYWISHPDLDATMNYGIMHFEALESDGLLTFKCFLDYELDTPDDKTYDFSTEETGFILDISFLDVGVLGDGRTIRRATGYIDKTARSLLVGFYQTGQDLDVGLIKGQIDASKNGNPFV